MKILIGFITLCFTITAIVFITSREPGTSINESGDVQTKSGIITVSALHDENFDPTEIVYMVSFKKRDQSKTALTESLKIATGKLVEFSSTLNISKDSISANNFSLEKAWKWVNNRNVPDGFEISQSFRVVLSHPEKSTEFIEGIANIGDLEIQNSYSQLSSYKEKRNAIYETAIKDAKEKASAIAKASGRSVGRVLFIADESAPSSYYVANDEYASMGRGAMLMNAKMEAPRAIINQKINIGVSVTMKFEIK
ncbi:MAG: SIMPL domain-containing protein [Fibrobacteraceae bacterium]|nr:SIMPL domain-containing protein [Fibrobacteraceae bacterium]